jgi:hypothetical protein
MIADLLEVHATADRGHGVFARAPIPAGTVIGVWCDACQIVGSQEELARRIGEDRARLIEHTYVTPEGKLVLDCSIGRYMNHCCDPHVLEVEDAFDIAVRDIAPGEEVCCDYRQFDDPGDEGFPCACGAPNCCGHMRRDWPPPEELATWWRRLTDEACARLRLPHRFARGTGDGVETVPTWWRGAGGRWHPPEAARRSPAVAPLGRLLARRDRVPLVAPPSASSAASPVE